MKWQEKATRLLKTKGIKQKQVADALGIGVAAVSAKLLGNRGCTPAEVSTIAYLLNISVDELISSDERINKPGDIDFIRKYRELSTEDKKVIERLINSMGEE